MNIIIITTLFDSFLCKLAGSRIAKVILVGMRRERVSFMDVKVRSNGRFYHASEIHPENIPGKMKQIEGESSSIQYKKKRGQTLFSLSSNSTWYGPNRTKSHVRYILSVPSARFIPVNHIHHLAQISIIRQPLPHKIFILS